MERESKMENLGLKDYYSYFKNKKVLVTGHTGFKGSWLTIWLNMLGAEVIGIALEPRSEKDNFVLSGIGTEIMDYREDIRNLNAVKKIIEKEKPEILFHLAAQPIVLDSYDNPVYTYETNVMGTVNLLEVFRKSTTLKTGIFITTDKCYENKEWIYGYRENDPMGGYDPYSSSKGAAELIISSYRNSYFRDSEKKIASTRAGNVIGGGDWAPNRLVVDIIKSIEKDKPIEIRNPKAIRPWQHVLEPLSGYLLLASRIGKEKKMDEAWNFGPNLKSIVSVKELMEQIISKYGKGEWIDKSAANNLHEANLLALDISKAHHKLGWTPVLSMEETIYYTTEWYKSYRHVDVRKLCEKQINSYMKKWISKNGK